LLKVLPVFNCKAVIKPPALVIYRLLWHGVFMNLTIPLEKMSVADKLGAIEIIWSDLVSHSAKVPSPAWHADVLRARDARIAAGEAEFFTIAEAKQAVRNRINECQSS